MSAALPTGLIDAILERMETAYVRNGWRLFFPQQFMVLAPLEQVILALAKLRAVEQLDATAVVHCVNGHQVWAGEPEEALKHVYEPCPRCSDEAVDEPVLSFEMSSAWRARLDAQKKKSLSRA